VVPAVQFLVQAPVIARAQDQLHEGENKDTMMKSMTARRMSVCNAETGIPMVHKISEGTHMCGYFTTGLADLET
jgi:hypothetical protein